MPCKQAEKTDLSRKKQLVQSHKEVKSTSKINKWKNEKLMSYKKQQKTWGAWEQNVRNEDTHVERDQIMQAFVYVSFTQHTYRNSANYKHTIVNKGDKGRKNGLFNKQYDKSKQFRKRNGQGQDKDSHFHQFYSTQHWKF